MRQRHDLTLITFFHVPNHSYKICNVLTDIFNFDIIFFDKNEFFKSNKAEK